MNKPQYLCYLLAVLVMYGGTVLQYAHGLDDDEHTLLVGAALALLWLGWIWTAWRCFSVAVGILAGLAIWCYAGHFAAGETQFLLRYFLSSPSAFLWMCVLLLLATLLFWLALWRDSLQFAQLAQQLTWGGVTFGLTGFLVRWHESYLLGPDSGHIPLSNLYEVLLVFCLISTLFYLYYGAKSDRLLGSLVLLPVAAAILFVLWYSLTLHAQQIQPLIPALQSWWMKIHVPANFIGYGAFSFAAMLGVAVLLVEHGTLRDRLPRIAILQDLMYRAVALGFLFFTLATFLGALWAAEAWGAYWSWDPKETWAFIVWLNYAAWLHMRLVKGWRGRVLAWWAVSGLVLTAFAFIGVNVWLSGLHSYGSL